VIEETEGAAVRPGGIGDRLHAFESLLTQLLRSPSIPFDKQCRSSLPAAPGVYRIYDPTSPDETIRAGRTNTAAGGLQQRVYGNHLMGTQAGNLRAQLVRGGACADAEAAKQYIRDRFRVQVLVIQDDRERGFFEHFMLAVLQPRYSDRDIDVRPPGSPGKA